jgi:hypothetical protein
MKRTSVALVVGMLATSSARAEPIWSYRAPSNESIKSDGAAAGLTFPNTGYTTWAGDRKVLATSVVAWSLANADSPDAVGRLPYTFAVELLDDASGQAGSVSFGGVLDGAIWKTGASLTNTFTGPTSRTLDLGDHRYTVAVDAFESPLGFGTTKAGSITADVTVTTLGDPADPPPAPRADPQDPEGVHTPEPGTIALLGIGVATAGIWRGRRAGARPHNLRDGRPPAPPC